MNHSRLNPCVALLALIMTVGLADGTTAQEMPTVNSVEQARTSVDNGHFLTAIDYLNQHLRNNPKDASAMVVLASAYNGLSMHSEALDELHDAVAMGHDSPELHDAFGQAYLGLRMAEEALEHLRQGPNTADNRLAQSAAMIGTGDYNGAIRQADAAEQLDPNLEYKARMLRSIAMARGGQREQAQAELDEGISRAQSVEQEALYQGLQQSLAQMPESFDAEAPDDRWGWQVTVGWSWSSNISLRPNNSGGLGPVDLADSEDQSISESANIWYRLTGDKRSGLVASALIAGSQNFSSGEYNTIATGGGLYAYHHVKQWSLEGGVAYNFNAVDGEAYGHTASLFGSVTLRETDWTATTFGYRVAFREYMFAADLEEDRDGDLHTFTLSQSFKVPVFGRDLQLAVFGQAGIENTDGGSAENTSWAVGVRTQYQLTEDIAIYASYVWRERKYANPNVRVVFAFDRKDDEWQAAAGLTWKIKSNISLNAGWSYTEHSSNIPLSFSYEQHVVGVSLTITGP